MLTEEIRPRGTEAFYYSAQKAELEEVLAEATGGAELDSYVLRPCIVAGRDAPALVEGIFDALELGGRLAPLRHALGAVPTPAPVLPDPGVPFQLVHHDDVAAAVRAATPGSMHCAVRC